MAPLRGLRRQAAPASARTRPGPGALGAVIATTQISDLSFSDRLVEIGDWVGGGTLLLAALAAVVALQAYAASTGLPDLKCQIKVPSSGPNEVVFEASQAAADALITVSGTFRETSALISVYNMKRLLSAESGRRGPVE